MTEESLTLGISCFPLNPHLDSALDNCGSVIIGGFRAGSHLERLEVEERVVGEFREYKCRVPAPKGTHEVVFYWENGIIPNNRSLAQTYFISEIILIVH